MPQRIQLFMKLAVSTEFELSDMVVCMSFAFAMLDDAELNIQLLNWYPLGGTAYIV